MAMKDWKKQKYTPKGVTVYYIDEPYSPVLKIEQIVPGAWEVLITIGLNNKVRKYYKTKKAATAYAKRYMSK